MKLVSGVLGMTLASAVAIVSANAADMYRAPEGVSYKDAPVVAPWTGPYVGINGGYAWGRDSDLTATPPQAPRIDPPFASEGWFAGGQVGYNWQGVVHPQIVLGVEADIQGADINGSGVITGLASAENKLDWFGTVRGRLGYSVGQALLYGTGGVAFGGLQDKLTVASTTVKHDATATGYAAGGGVEYSFNPAWSGKVEYQYINLGNDSLAATDSGGATGTAKFDHEYNTVRLGLNYHIQGGYEPLK